LLNHLPGRLHRDIPLEFLRLAPSEFLSALAALAATGRNIFPCHNFTRALNKALNKDGGESIFV
jgi:hypothetical protein